ncbi:hypothetical protein FB45DRAFT_1139697 [Roridomyces roridus]|uniref:DUF6534 domain-containing protein n=1 Tax=Roridomyces roridus TaxID=1738132 RepID=A0AAD7FU20_9AGAR|nr:hypothetical protein FB45DRAFT_1139697 [Roridomyces roridus]
MPDIPDVKLTIGAALVGSFVSVALSAIVGFQCFLYFRIFVVDQIRYKIVVLWIWILDALHTVLVCAIIWEFAIAHFGDSDVIHTIFPTIPSAVIVLGLTSLIANGFYGLRIHKQLVDQWSNCLLNDLSSGCQLFIVLIGSGLSVSSQALAFPGAVEMILEKNFTRFSLKFRPLVTVPLIFSAFTDVVVSGARYYYLHDLKEGYLMSQEVLDGIVVFTVNDGCITCAVAIAGAICWLTMPDNFIWLALFFSLPKFYSNSVLATYASDFGTFILVSQKWCFRLNLRNWYRHRPVHPMIPMKRTTLMGPSSRHIPPSPTTDKRPPRETDLGVGVPARMEVFVDHQVEYVGDLAHARIEQDEDAHSRSSHKSMVVS